MAHASPPHETEVAQLPKPEHLRSATPAPRTAPAQAVDPEQSMLHFLGDPRHEAPAVHALPPVHEISQSSALQLTGRAQLPCSMQSTLQREPAHCTVPPQLIGALQ